VTANRLTQSQIEEGLKRLRGWALKEGALFKRHRFPDFKAAMAFANRVAELAESQDHHPDILIQFHTVQLTLVTHSAQGLTEKDFRLAEAIDALFS
jgi:4a-hydroxytetrahydrobiopterin dehydratase